MQKKFYCMIPSLMSDSTKIKNNRKIVFSYLLDQLIDVGIQPIVYSQNYKKEDYIKKNQVIYIDGECKGVNYARQFLYEYFLGLTDSYDLGVFFDDDLVIDEVFYKRINFLNFLLILEQNKDKISCMNLVNNTGNCHYTNLHKINPWTIKDDLKIHLNRTGLFSVSAYILNRSKVNYLNFMEIDNTLFEQEYVFLKIMRNKETLWTNEQPIMNSLYKTIRSVFRDSFKKNNTNNTFEKEFKERSNLIIDYIKDNFKDVESIIELDSYDPMVILKIQKEITSKYNTSNHGPIMINMENKFNSSEKIKSPLSESSKFYRDYYKSSSYKLF